MFRDLVLKTRSYRRFDQSQPISVDTLRDLVDLARLTASASNMQPLKYILVSSPQGCARVFERLAWAGYLKDWPGPAEGERPTGYIIILGDRSIRADFGCDHGIVAQTMLLAATERGLGGCMLGAIQRAELARDLEIPTNLDIQLVVALGVPAENVVLEDVAPGESIKYYRDADETHHVPKRSLEEVIFTTL